MEKQLPKNWVETQINTIAETSSGGTPNTSVKEYWDGNIPWINSGKLKDEEIFEPSRLITERGLKESSAKLFPVDSVVIALTGATTGKLGYLKIETSTNQSVTGIFPNKFYNSKLIFYQLKNLRNDILSQALGSAQPHINKKIVDETKIKLPPLPEQNRIVTKLDALFAQLETIKSSMDTVPLLLKDFRKQVLTQAVTGKLTEEWRKGKDFNIPNEDFVNRTLLKENKELNKTHLIEGRSKIKLNPISFINKNEINWSVFTIESLCIVIVDCLHETATFSNDGYKLIDTNNIESFKINKNKLRYVDASVYKKWVSRLKPEYGDIVYTREGTIGNALMIPENDKYCIGQRTMLFRFSKLMNEKFCELYMNSEAFKNQVKPHIKGVASQHVNIRDLRLLEIPAPSLEEQQEIVSRVESLFSKADAIEKQYESLKIKIDNLPQALLHKAFKGELTEQLASDGDAKELLKQIQELKAKVEKVKKRNV